MKKEHLKRIIGSSLPYKIRTSSEEFAKAPITWAESFEEYQVEVWNDGDDEIMVTFTPNKEYFNKCANSDFTEWIKENRKEFINELIESAAIFKLEFATIHNVEIKYLPHFQSGKKVEHLIILGKDFLLSDKRGYTTYATIDRQFAEEIIDSFETELDTQNKPIYYPERLSSEVRLKWDIYPNNRIQLKIHGATQHIWSSKIISIIYND